MSCHQCSFKRDQPGTAKKSCRAIKEHPVFRHLSLEDKATLEIYISSTGKLPYLTPDGKPLVKIEPLAVANGSCYWPSAYDPHAIEDCKLFTLREDIVGFKTL